MPFLSLSSHLSIVAAMPVGDAHCADGAAMEGSLEGHDAGPLSHLSRKLDRGLDRLCSAEKCSDRERAVR
jgi:hypothetical protein